MKILVFERHEIINNRLLELILDNFSDAIVINVISYQEVLAFARTRMPDVVLVAIQRPETELPDIIAGLKNNFPAMLIIVLYTHIDDLLVFQAVQAGADYVLCKYDQMDELIYILNTYKTVPAVKCENNN